MSADSDKQLMKKQAILILAHQCNDVLYSLIESFGAELYDVFIHFDANASETVFEDLKAQILTRSGVENVFLTPRIHVKWGAPSMVAAELTLFEYANEKGDYAYYHLISGADFPLINPVLIHEIFTDRTGEYVEVQDDKEMSRKRFSYYYPFMEMGVRNKNAWWMIQKIFTLAQKVF